MEKAVSVVIAGRVQGVGFRAATQHKAASLGLVGWVQNRGDGAVIAFAQGTPPAVDALLAWCHSGPPSSKVASVVSVPVTLDNTLKTFAIRRD